MNFYLCFLPPKKSLCLLVQIHERKSGVLLAKWKWKFLSCVQLFATPWTPLYSPRNSPGQNTGSLLQGIFPTQGWNPGLPRCRQILYQLSPQGSPEILEWAACPFSLPDPGTGGLHCRQIPNRLIYEGSPCYWLDNLLLIKLAISLLGRPMPRLGSKVVRWAERGSEMWQAGWLCAEQGTRPPQVPQVGHETAACPAALP